MLDDTEQLLVLVEAKISDFEKNMRKAERTGTKTYRDLNRGSQSATRTMERDMGRATRSINRDLAVTSTQIGKVGAAFKGFVAGAVVTAAGLAISRTGDMARSIAEIGDEAERAGVSARVFQEWKFVAEQNRIGIDSMVDGLKELNLRADEFVVTGKGPAAEAFTRLGYTATDLETKLKDPSALMLEIIGRLGELDKAAQIRVSDEIFGGTAGERFVELIDEGVEGIGRTIDRAHDLGVVMDDEMIAKADEVNRRFNEISNTVGVKLKSAIVSAADSLADFLDGFREFEDQRSSSLEGRVNEIIRERAQLYERLQDLESGKGFNLNRNFDIGVTKGEIDQLSREEDEIIAVLQGRTAPQWSPNREQWTPPDIPVSKPSGGSGSGGGSRTGTASLDELQREIQLIQERTQALNADTAAQANMNPLIDDFGYAVEKAAATHDLMNAALEAGVELTPNLREQIEALANAYGRAHVESEKLGQSQEETRARVGEMDQLRSDSMKGFIRDLVSGRDATEALNNALARVGDRLLEMSLESIFTGNGSGGSQGQSGGGIGAVVGGFAKSILGFSKGTANTGGARGEPRGIVHGQEAVIPLPDGGRVPVQIMGQSGGIQKVEVEVSVANDGNLKAFAKQTADERIAAASPQLHRHFMSEAQRSAPGWVQDHNMRYG